TFSCSILSVFCHIGGLHPPREFHFHHQKAQPTSPSPSPSLANHSRIDAAIGTTLFVPSEIKHHARPDQQELIPGSDRFLQRIAPLAYDLPYRPKQSQIFSQFVRSPVHAILSLHCPSPHRLPRPQARALPHPRLPSTRHKAFPKPDAPSSPNSRSWYSSRCVCLVLIFCFY